MAQNSSNGIHLLDLFKENEPGIHHSFGEFGIDDSKDNLEKRLIEFCRTDSKLSTVDVRRHVQVFLSKPFDIKYFLNHKFFVGKTVPDFWGNERNLILVLVRQSAKIRRVDCCPVIISRFPVDANLFEGGVHQCPLYLNHNNYLSHDSDQYSFRSPNLDEEIVKQIAGRLDLTFTSEKKMEGEVCFINSHEVRPEYRQSFDPIDLLDYIYAVLNNPSFRENYHKYLKYDNPLVPYPKDNVTFWKLVNLGSQLRQVHLLESSSMESLTTNYVIEGTNQVKEVTYINGNVFINEAQFFANIPPITWEFCIGGYKPAQKWLKNRVGKALNLDEVLYYQMMVDALKKTDTLVNDIAKVELY